MPGMKNSRCLINLTFFFMQVFSLVACEAVQPTTTEPLPSSTPASVTPTTATQPTSSALPPTITLSPILETPTSASLPIEYPQPGTVVLDFVAQACRADWANGALHIPCPGNPNHLAEGFITLADQAIAEGEIPVNAPVLIYLPGSGNTHGAGLFGKYPPLLIQTGNTFHAIPSCQEGTSCDVEFAYY